MGDMRVRSALVVAGDAFQQVKEGLNWSPDALCLDLDWLVHPSRRAQARDLAWAAISATSHSRSLAMARIGLQEAEEDLKAVVWPGLAAVVVPDLEGPEAVRDLDQRIAALERERQLPAGTVKLIPFLSTGRGLWSARDIATASPRVTAIALGMGDLLYEMTGTHEAAPYITGPVPRFPVPEYNWSRLGFIAAAAGVHLLGLLGATVAPGHARGHNLERAVNLARQAGFRGAFTLHQEGVAACNRGFAVPVETLKAAGETAEMAHQGLPVHGGKLRLARALLAQAEAARSVGQEGGRT